MLWLVVTSVDRLVKKAQRRAAQRQKQQRGHHAVRCIFRHGLHPLPEGWRIFRRDRYQHASPNSAQTEAACAGLMGLRLAGGGRASAFFTAVPPFPPAIGVLFPLIVTSSRGKSKGSGMTAGEGAALLLIRYVSRTYLKPLSDAAEAAALAAAGDLTAPPAPIPPVSGRSPPASAGYVPPRR